MSKYLRFFLFVFTGVTILFFKETVSKNKITEKKDVIGIDLASLLRKSKDEILDLLASCELTTMVVFEKRLDAAEDVIKLIRNEYEKTKSLKKELSNQEEIFSKKNSQPLEDSLVITATLSQQENKKKITPIIQKKEIDFDEEEESEEKKLEKLKPIKTDVNTSSLSSTTITEIPSIQQSSQPITPIINPIINSVDNQIPNSTTHNSPLPSIASAPISISSDQINNSLSSQIPGGNQPQAITPLPMINTTPLSQQNPLATNIPSITPQPLIPGSTVPGQNSETVISPEPI